MARAMFEDDAQLYRAVIRNAAGQVAYVCGPYTAKGPATAAVNRETGSPTGRTLGYTGTVETAEVTWSPYVAQLAAEMAAPQAPLHSFTPWPKTSRLLRSVIVTEKIDGTNAAIAIRPAGLAVGEDDSNSALVFIGAEPFRVFAQSRKRIITPGKSTDNYGFAAWVWGNAGELASILGPGLHYGEWWGAGINRGYGLPPGERRFSLFNTDKHPQPCDAMTVGSVPVAAVPVLYRGVFNTVAIQDVLRDLGADGSYAAPFWRSPEGVCVFHSASRQTFKITLDANDAGKWEASA